MKKIIFTMAAIFILLSCTSCNNTPATSTPTASGQTSTPSTNSAETIYKIADYYNADGSFSALGLALDEKDSEKVLVVKEGDIIVVENQKYSVTEESLTLSFYTQPSLDEVIDWWTDHCGSLAGNGRITELS